MNAHALTETRIDAAHLADLLRKEHGAMADFIVALAAFDRQRGWAELGHASLWYFLHRDLGLSKGTASHRKVAAGLVQRFPSAEAALRDGRLCLSTAIELSHVLTPENEAAVLPASSTCRRGRPRWWRRSLRRGRRCRCGRWSRGWSAQRCSRRSQFIRMNQVPSAARTRTCPRPRP